MANREETASPTCRLLALPAELRNQIYAHLFHGAKIHIDNSLGSKLKNATQLALLLTNRQLHQEALDALLTEATFLYHQTNVLKRILSRVSPEHQSRIRHLQISGAASSAAQEMEWMEINFERLQRAGLKVPRCAFEVYAQYGAPRRFMRLEDESE